MGFPFIKGGAHNINSMYLRSFKINVVVYINYHISFFGGWGRVITTGDSILFKVRYSNNYNFFLCLLQDLQLVQEDVSESLKIAVSDFSKIEKDNVIIFLILNTPTVNAYIAISWVNNSTMADPTL